jgi:MFS family permease
MATFESTVDKTVLAVGADAPAESVASKSTQRHLLVSGMLCYGFDAMDFMVLTLALPLMIVEWNLTLAQAGLMGTAGMIGVGLSGIAVGWYADRYGRRPALIASVIVFALFTAAICLARNRWEVMALRFVAGFGIGGVWGVVTTLIKEAYPANKHASAVSWVLSSWPIGVSLAALLAAVVLPNFGWRALFLCGAVALFGALHAYRRVPESAVWQANRARKESAQAGDIRRIFSARYGRNTIIATLVASSMLIAYWGINTWLPTYLIKERGLAASKMSLYLLVLNAGMFCGYPVLARLADSIGKRRALIVSFFIVSIVVPIYAAIGNPTLILVLGPIMAIGFSQTGLLGAYFPELFPTEVRSLGAGFCFNVGRGVAAFAPFVLGQLATTLGLGTSIALCGIGYLAACLLMFLLPEHPPHASNHE